MVYILAESLTIIGMGFLLGIQHAFDADHMVAVTTLVSKHKNFKKASLFGAFWGIGHTTTLLIAGILILLFKISIPKNMALSFEFIVGIMITVLGILVLRDIFISKKHIHNHTHGKEMHLHVHSHLDSEEHNHYHKPFIVGIIHGMAGSAALMLLVLATVESLWVGLFYILIFGVGSIIGMSIVSGLISVPFVFTGKSTEFDMWNKRIRYFAGSVGILFGMFLMIKIGYFEGLFF